MGDTLDFEIAAKVKNVASMTPPLSQVPRCEESVRATSILEPTMPLDRPCTTLVHVERSSCALDDLLRNHDLLDTLKISCRMMYPHRRKTDCSTFSAKLKATPTHSRTVMISEATQSEPMGSWPLESGYAIRLLAFLAHEAMVAGLARWAVCDRSAPRFAQDLCATTWQPQPLSRQRKVPRWLERWSSPGSLPARESLSLMVGFAWPYSMLFELTTWVFDLTVSPYLLRCGHRLWSSSSRHRLWPVASRQNASAVT